MTKARKIVLSGLIATFLCTMSLASYTYARYVTERGNDPSSKIDQTVDLPFDVLNKIEVTTQEELFTALENGYPYIALSDKVRDPLVVTQETMNVKKSMVLDLNGKRLERIGSNAMMNVGTGVVLTIIDTSADKTGGLYNPVGTVLEIEGGTLDVRGGKYESGPRTWEYTSANALDKKDWKNLGDDRTIVGTQDVMYTARDADGNPVEPIVKQMPVITPNITKQGEKIVSVDGNLYFDTAYTADGNTTSETLIPADTYCYYVTGDSFANDDTVTFDQTVADFSYSYYAVPNMYTYISAEKPAGVSGTDYVQITVYGFEKNIQTAMGKKDLNADALIIGEVDLDAAPYYAAVKMDSGSLRVNCFGSELNLIEKDQRKTSDRSDYRTDFGSGCFISYFGVETAACVQYTGGTMVVDTNGVFATVNPAVIRDINPDALSSEGRGICVHNNGKITADGGGTLTINGARFLSYNMSMIRLMAGTCNVSNGRLFRYQDNGYYYGDNTYNRGTGGVYTAGGDITVNRSEFYMYSEETVELVGDTIEDKMESLDYHGTYAIYSAGGLVKVQNSEISVTGDACRGIYSRPFGRDNSNDGVVSAYNTKIAVTGAHTFGIYVRGGIVQFDGSMPTNLDVLLKSTDDNEVLKGYSSSITVKGTDSMGIYATLNLAETISRDSDSIILTNTALLNRAGKDGFNTAYFSAGLNAINAKISFDGVYLGSDGYGVYSRESDLKVNDCRLGCQNASAVILVKGNLSGSGYLNLYSHITEEYITQVGSGFELDEATVANTFQYMKTYAGVDIVNGSFVLESQKDKEAVLEYVFNTDVVTPKNIDRIGNADGTNKPYLKKENGDQVPLFNEQGSMSTVASFLPSKANAIRISGKEVKNGEMVGEVALGLYANCTITANQGGGVLVRGGNVEFGRKGSEREITIQTTGTESYNYKGDENHSADHLHRFTEQSSWSYYDNKTGGDAMFVSGGSVISNVKSLKLLAAHGNGLLVTAADMVSDTEGRYKGEVQINTAKQPTVEIFNGEYQGNVADGYITHPADMAGPAVHFGVKVVCGAKAIIRGGTFGGRGAVCTIGSSTFGTSSDLEVYGNYANATDRITMSGVKDVACFYSNSNVKFTSTDNPAAKVKSTGECENRDDFGISIVGGDTCFVIEKKLAGGHGSTITINGGYYRATKGDYSGAKVFWCSNDTADLIIQGGWFIGNSFGSYNGGAVQTWVELDNPDKSWLKDQYGLKNCVLSGGHFIDLSGKGPISVKGTVGASFGTETQAYELNTSSDGYFVKSDSDTAIVGAPTVIKRNFYVK